MDDLKDIQGESSFVGMPTMDDQAHRLEKTSISNNVWESLENNIDKELESSEFTGGMDTYESDSPASQKPVESMDLPEGFEGLPPSEEYLSIPSAEEERYQGPSADGGYQSSDSVESAEPVEPPQVPSIRGGEYVADEVDEATRPLATADKTLSIQQEIGPMTSSSAMPAGTDAERTVAVDGFANARLGARKNPDVDVKVSVGNYRGARGVANVLTSVDASLAQAESLKLAQQRILDLEKEVELLRAENEELASAGEIIRNRTDELAVRISGLEKEKLEVQESAQSEILVLKGNLQFKETEVAKARVKVDELETRLKSDFKKIRVRERELENRLELLRAEKSALVRSKDEYILEQKRKIDQLSQELDNYRKKCLELNKAIEANQDQFKRTERALRLALTNLEAKEDSAVPLKKAE